MVNDGGDWTMATCAVCGGRLTEGLAWCPLCYTPIERARGDEPPERQSAAPQADVWAFGPASEAAEPDTPEPEAPERKTVEPAAEAARPSAETPKPEPSQPAAEAPTPDVPAPEAPGPRIVPKSRPRLEIVPNVPSEPPAPEPTPDPRVVLEPDEPRIDLEPEREPAPGFIQPVPAAGEALAAPDDERTTTPGPVIRARPERLLVLPDSPAVGSPATPAPDRPARALGTLARILITVVVIALGVGGWFLGGTLVTELGSAAQVWRLFFVAAYSLLAVVILWSTWRTQRHVVLPESEPVDPAGPRETQSNPDTTRS